MERGDEHNQQGDAGRQHHPELQPQQVAADADAWHPQAEALQAEGGGRLRDEHEGLDESWELDVVNLADVRCDEVEAKEDLE